MRQINDLPLRHQYHNRFGVDGDAFQLWHFGAEQGLCAFGNLVGSLDGKLGRQMDVQGAGRWTCRLSATPLAPG